MQSLALIIFISLTTVFIGVIYLTLGLLIGADDLYANLIGFNIIYCFWLVLMIPFKRLWKIIRSSRGLNEVQIAITLPEKIIYVSGTSSSSQSKEIEVDGNSIISALGSNDHLDNYNFPKGTVRVQPNATEIGWN